ncbi:MAG: PEP-CTERM sorting domain-containing protein, partial [Acidobacteriaceae bacterium]|nr:PEP-CTERM sorting domain-containing protein [Acidobacteriaceae bacterium]
ELTEEQVATILQSPLVQTDATGQRFIQITPIAIVAAPEPPTLLLLLGAVALGALLLRHTNQSGAGPI